MRKTQIQEDVQAMEFPEATAFPVLAQGAPTQTLLRIDQLGSLSRSAKRDIEECFNEAKAMVHLDKKAAESCSYSLPRGGRNITGPSIRLAEIMQHAWGNILVSIDSFTVEKDELSGRVSVKVWGWAMDTQKNNAVQSFESATVFPKKGRGVDDDAISNAIDRARAMLYRDLVFKVIPKAYVNVVYNEAITAALGGAQDLKTKIDKVIDRFEKAWGVTEEDILIKLKRPNRSTMDQDDVATLMGWGTAIKDGHMTVAELFGAPQGGDDEEEGGRDE